jgi:hypothetical protein
MGWGVEGGDRIVATSCMPECGPKQRLLYLFCSDDERYTLRLCTSTERGAVFRAAGDDIEPMIGNVKQTTGDNFAAGLVVAVIRSGEYLHANAWNGWRDANLDDGHRAHA